MLKFEWPTFIIFIFLSLSCSAIKEHSQKNSYLDEYQDQLNENKDSIQLCTTNYSPKKEKKSGPNDIIERLIKLIKKNKTKSLEMILKYIKTENISLIKYENLEKLIKKIFSDFFQYKKEDFILSKKIIEIISDFFKKQKYNEYFFKYFYCKKIFQELPYEDSIQVY